MGDASRVPHEHRLPRGPSPHTSFWSAVTFFPLSELPQWVQILGEFNPLHHCVELVRHAAFGSDGWTDLARVAALIGFALLTWRIAIYAMTRKLVD